MSTSNDDFDTPEEATELTGGGWANPDTQGTGDGFVPPDSATEAASGGTTESPSQDAGGTASEPAPYIPPPPPTEGTDDRQAPYMPTAHTSPSDSSDLLHPEDLPKGAEDRPAPYRPSSTDPAEQQEAADGSGETETMGSDYVDYTDTTYKVSSTTMEMETPVDLGDPLAMESGDLASMEGDISTRAWQINEAPEGDSEGESWVPEESTTLDSLLDFVKNYDMTTVERDDDEADWFLTKEGAARLDEKYPPPWAAGYGMRMVAFGGVNSEERRRVIIAPRTLRSMVSGDLNVTVEGKGEMRAEWSSMDSVSGTDRLVVNGDVDQTFKSRTTIITHGSVNRVWLGRIHRFVGQEGVICAGVFARMYFGIQMTMSAVASGDVYGGAIKTAGVRFYLSKFGYRASKTANWAMAAYLRTGMVVLEPAVNTLAQDGPVPKAKKAAGIIAALCPFIEILGGLAMLPISLVIAIINKKRKKKPPPPAGPPRCRTISCGNIIEISATNVTT